MAEDFVMNYRFAKFNALGTIDCEFEHPIYGWIPFTASPDDVEGIGREVYELASQGSVAAYVPLGETLDGRAAVVRAKRDRLLAETDWTQLEDTPPQLKQAHKTYRQALRDIPQQPGFPMTVSWPVKP